MVTVQFNFKTILEAQEFLANTASSVARVISDPEFAVDDPESEVTVETPKKPKKESKPKVEAEDRPDVYACRVALERVIEKRGIQEATALLSAFKVARVSELKPGQFAEFISDCNVQAK